MASALQSVLLLFIAAVSLLISPATSQLPRTCESQTFNQTYAYCLDLHTLRAYLHWTYAAPFPTRLYPTLDIAFLAPPAGPDGWVAWALNPTSSRMDGAQALIAFRDANGSLAVRTYNISSYASIAESPIAYLVLSSRAEFSGGLMRIFATLAMPAGGPTELNTVFQVGAAVRNGVPAAHELGEQNLNSRMTVNFSQDPGPTGERGRRTDPAGSGWRVSAGGGFGLYGGLVLLLGGVFLGF